MALSPQAAVEAADAVWNVRRNEYDELEKIDNYLKGDHAPAYQPKSATTEYKALTERRISNYLPLVVDAIAQDLYVEGYRLPDDVENARPWEQWRANSMDSRQIGIHRAAVAFGLAYAVVLPGDNKSAVINPKSPRRLTAVFDDPVEDEWPVWAAEFRDVRLAAGLVRECRLYDDVAAYKLSTEPDSDKLILRETKFHRLGQTPVVRYLNRIDLSGRPVSAIQPLIPIQDRINETTFGLLMAQNYAAFRQRWVTGLDIPTDPETGEDVEPFNAAVDRVWHTDDPTAKFGEFSQTDLSGYLNSREASIRDMAAIAQIPPQALSVPISNLSADALALIQQGHERSVLEHKSLFGESHKATMRLAALACGDKESADETEGRIIWRDTEARSLAQTVDALGKLATMLDVPKQALWERVPGVTTTEVQEWRKLAEEGDALAILNATLDRQAVAEVPAAPVAPPTNGVTPNA